MLNILFICCYVYGGLSAVLFAFIFCVVCLFMIVSDPEKQSDREEMKGTVIMLLLSPFWGPILSLLVIFKFWAWVRLPLISVKTYLKKWWDTKEQKSKPSV